MSQRKATVTQEWNAPAAPPPQDLSAVSAVVAPAVEG